MELDHVTFVGPPIDDGEILAKIPANLAGLLQQLNGFIQFHGGLHVRGACRQPSWHSLRDAWVGVHAFHSLYPAVHLEDIPFAEDCLGDQFILRDGRVLRLSAETGELQALNLDLAGFFHAVQADPIEFLSLEPLLQFQRDGARWNWGSCSPRTHPSAPSNRRTAFTWRPSLHTSVGGSWRTSPRRSTMCRKVGRSCSSSASESASVPERRVGGHNGRPAVGRKLGPVLLRESR